MLLGHSQGGWLAQIYAAVFPDNVHCTSNENISLLRINITQGSMGDGNRTQSLRAESESIAAWYIHVPMAIYHITDVS